MIKNALHAAEIDRLDAELLLCHVLGKNRTWLISHPDPPLLPHKEKQFYVLTERRKKHEPIAYIIGEKEFYGRIFTVDERVLIPRPSTETLIDEVKTYFSGALKVGTHTKDADTNIVIFSELKDSRIPKRIIDIGTGSGCIGITLALEIPNIEVLCTDISAGALEVAKENAERHKVLDRVSFVEADCLPSNAMLRYTTRLGAQRLARGTQHDMSFLLVANPPYIPVGEELPEDISAYEPHEALYAGADGMDVLRELSKQCEDSELCCGSVFECQDEQGKKLAAA